MRYYEFVMNTSAEQIAANARIKLKHYAYENSIASLNNYMYQNMKNDVCFFAYREEENAVCAAFSFNERKKNVRETFEELFGMLREAFFIKRTPSEPEEITMGAYLDHLMEAGRREYQNVHRRIADASRLWMYTYYQGQGAANDPEYGIHFRFRERIIPEKEKTLLCDRTLTEELRNIETHENTTGHTGNPVHYVISARSIEAAGDIAEALAQRLYRANRISSRRMEIIYDMEPDVFRRNHHLEEILENHYGGMILFDLTERFGCDPVDYAMTAKYLLELLKKYRNQCLFVFLYNMEHPGFSYAILPEISRYVIPVAIREGSGDRRAAVNCLKSLIEGSEYAAYAGQAGEFLRQYPGKTFSQTDVLSAYEQFEPWCLNRNILHSYRADSDREFLLDRDEHATSAYERLQGLVGLGIVKEQIDAVIAADLVERERKKRKGNAYRTSSMHMIFAGNPGTAKTTVARLFAGIAKERGLLKSGAFVERGGMDLDGLCCVHAIRNAFRAARGGVLFIDEAYAIRSDTAVTVLIQEMENRRDEVIVILAGYGERMREFLKSNEGLKSRIPHRIEFPDYNTDELTDIFRLMLAERGFQADEGAVTEARDIFDKVRRTDDFGNGRYVRNLIERAEKNQAVRLLAGGKEAGDIRKKELFRITKEDVCMLEEGLTAGRPAGTAERELSEMIGLTSVKDVIRKAVAHYRLRKLCMEKGIQRDVASLHMVFTGNPGTAKTTVARLFAEILKDEKVLPSGTFVEAGRADLIGDHVGSTAPLVRRKFREAQGGVLFIDEAYALCDGYENGFGDEAISTLVQEMENHREDVIVIFAGYPEPMKRFLDRNPGMRSRIAFHVAFEDYSAEELCEITRLMASRRQMRITDDAMAKLREIYERAVLRDDFGNGRFVRKILEETEMNLAERLLHTNGSGLTEERLTTIDVCDISEPDAEKERKKQRIGFAVAG